MEKKIILKNFFTEKSFFWKKNIYEHVKSVYLI